MVEDLLRGSSSDLEDMIVTTVVAANIAHGSNPEVMTGAKITMAVVTEAVMGAVTEAEAEEVTDRLHPLEAQLPGSSRNHTQVTARLAWISHHPLPLEEEYLHLLRRTIFRRHHHRLRRSSERDTRIRGLFALDQRSVSFKCLGQVRWKVLKK